MIDSELKQANYKEDHDCRLEHDQKEKHCIQNSENFASLRV